MKGKKYVALFISPHLDDAVFSCGGEIARCREQGPVLVLNIFSKFEGDATGAAVLLSHQRKIEDASAAEVLNFEVVNLEEPEAFFRDSRYQSISQIFMAPQRSDFEYLAQLELKLKSKLDEFDFEMLYIPMAVGWHIDHWLVCHAILNLKLKKKIFLYEDAPYRFVRSATELRFRELTGILGDGWFQFKSYLQLTLSFYFSGMMRNSTPLWLDVIAFPGLMVYFSRMIRSHRDMQQGLGLLQLECKIFDVTRYWKLKLAAIKKYQSQTKLFFFNENHIAECYQVKPLEFKGLTLLSHNKAGRKSDNVFYERFWQLDQTL